MTDRNSSLALGAAAPFEDRAHRWRAVELRFLLPSARSRDVLEWARGALTRDPHGTGEYGDSYRVSTICFDTPAFDVHERRGSYRRAKYRVRRYGDAEEVFAERKLRTQTHLFKRRSRLPLAELGDLLTHSANTHSGWFSRRLAVRRLNPVCQVSYVRVARLLVSPTAMARLTIDNRLQAFNINGPEFIDQGGIDLVPGFAVVELKFSGASPAAFRTLVERFALTPERFSKYRLALSGLGLTGAGARVRTLASSEDRS